MKKKSLFKTMVFDRFFLISVTIDIASFTAMYFVASLFTFLFYHKIDAIDLPDSVFELSEAQVNALASSMQFDFFYFIFLIVIALVLVWGIWIASRAAIWSLVKKENPSMMFLLKSIPMGFVWFLIGGIPLFLAFFTVRQNLVPYLILGYVMLFTYSSVVLFMIYAEKKNITCWLSALSVAASRYDLFIAYVILLLIFVVLYAVLNIITASLVGWVISLVIIFFYFAFCRFFLHDLFKKRG